MNNDLLKQYGLSESIIQESFCDLSLEVGRVITQNKGRYHLQTKTNIIEAEVSGKFMFLAKHDKEYPQIGDWVHFQRASETFGVIQKVFTRTSELSRKIAGRTFETQIIASNIDIVFICMGLDLDYNIRRLERYLSIVWNSRARPVVVLTKSDLSSQVDLQRYEVEKLAIGSDVVVCSNINGDGYKEIVPYLEKAKTIACIGSSGVGKSTLTNFIMGIQVMKTGNVRNDSRGRHTTTSRELFLSPYGCIVIDTPGMREIQIVADDLEMAFSDIEEIGLFCKYRDCTHTVEPGCKVLEAIELGELEYSRLKNYQKMLRELKRQETINKVKK